MIVDIDNSSSGCNAESRGKTTLRGDMSVGSFRDGKGDLCIDKSLTPHRDCFCFGAVEIVTVIEVYFSHFSNIFYTCYFLFLFNSMKFPLCFIPIFL